MKMQTSFLLSALMLSSSAMAADSSDTLTVGDLQQICTGQSAESKAACHFYILGVTQGVTMGISIADGKTNGGRPCIPDNIPADALELTVKSQIGADLMVFPEDKKLDAAGMVGAVLIKRFECNKTR